MNHKRIAIIGSKDFGQTIAHHITTDSDVQVVGFFDDFAPAGSQTELGPVLGATKEFEAHFKKGEFDAFIVGIGYRHLGFREEIFNKLKSITPAYTFIHSSCYIDPSVEIGAGCFLHPGCVIDKGSKVGENVLLNTGCTIAHDTNIGAHSFIAPGVTLAALSISGKNAF